ncbi:MAG TPA: beta-ketoacyl-[acyl-carrier-protein] synthase family protein [Bryobacteraceae bacterium]
MRRVAVTGIGVICAIGNTRQEFTAALRQGRCGIGEITLADVSAFRFRNGAEVHGYVPEQHFDPKHLDIIDRFAQFASIAAREAVGDAGVVWTDELRDRCIIVTGACVGGQTTEDQGFWDVYKLGKSRVHPMTIPRTMANAGASFISMDLGLPGPAWTVSTACSSSNHAIAQAFQLLRSGSADLALAGGSEATFSFGILKAWEAMRVVSGETCRPFSKDRSGMILGEGGAMLVLEPLDRAQARGARIYCEIAGAGMSADAHHITQPTVEGPVRAMRMALRDAGVAAGQVQYINAHGTGTDVNDVTETAAIRQVFAGHADHLAVSSTKSMHGHTLGAAGAIEAAATAIALREGFLPPTANYRVPDPRCDLDVIPNQSREVRVNCALSNSFAFGGLNAVLLFTSGL